MRLIPALAALIALAACDRPQKTELPAPTVDVKEVAAADGYGAPGAKINAVAFWSHPSVNFESLVLAATDAGVDAYSVESGERAGGIAQGAVTSMATIYAGTGPAAQGFVIAARSAGYEFYAIDNTSGEMTSALVESGAPGTGKFCAGNAGKSLALYEIDGDVLAARAISISATGVSLGDPTPLATIGGLDACHVDDRTGAVIAFSGDGAIRRLDPQTGESFGLAFIADGKPSLSALHLMTTAEPESAAGGAIAVLNGERGVISLFDLVDGHALGAVRIKSTFDLDDVASATSIAAGYGNYGGVYRDGALAVVTTGDGAPIRLVPFNGILDALGVTAGENVDPRAPQAAEADERVIEIEFEQP